MTEPNNPLLPGFESGPIRPPSEAYSLLLRVTRNCPWNRCLFCPVYKNEKFSRRSVVEVVGDIDCMAAWRDEIRSRSWRLGFGGKLDKKALQAIYQEDPNTPMLYSLLLFQLGGGRTVFLQDADSLMIKTEELVKILKHLREKFPKKNIEELKEIRAAGLDRIHIGLESGADAVLEIVCKGASQAEEVEAGRKAKEAGFELSEYVMPGLGGRKLSREHARETAKALNQINPDFIRLRTLGVPPRALLYELVEKKEFEPLNDIEVVGEIKLFIESLDGITSQLVSDHILNLLPELEGKFPEDKTRLLAICDRFLALPVQDQIIYVIGRRAGILETLDDLDDPDARERASNIVERLDIASPDEAQEVIQKLMENFI